MNRPPLLSIIIVSYNTASTTLNCLASILLDKGLKDTPYEIIIIDNHSQDDSLSLIKSFFKKRRFTSFHLIANDTNLGFGKANNQGIRVARGNFLLLLNSDTVILHSAISQTLDWLSSHPESYGCTAQLLNSDKSIQASGGYFPNLVNTFSWLSHLDDLPFVNNLTPPFHPHPPQFYLHSRFYLSDRPLDWITGAFMLLRKNIIDQVQGFNEDYFMYGEEMELCYRIHRKFPQLQLWYLVGPQIIHLGGASAKSKVEIYEREYQGITEFFRKHRPGYQLQLVELSIRLNRLLHQLI